MLAVSGQFESDMSKVPLSDCVRMGDNCTILILVDRFGCYP